MMYDPEDKELAEMRAQAEKLRLKKEMERMQTPEKAPEPAKMMRTAEHRSSGDHTVSLNTSIAIQKAIVSKFIGKEINISTDDWNTVAPLVEIHVVGGDESVTDSLARPD